MTAKNRLIRRLDVAETHLPTLVPTAPEPVRLRSTQDVIHPLEEQINAVRSARAVSPLAQARTVGRLAGFALKAIEVGQLAARLEMLEQVLKQRDGGKSR